MVWNGGRIVQPSNAISAAISHKYMEPVALHWIYLAGLAGNKMCFLHEGVSASFPTDRVERELQMVHK
jgi:hypothetical protein